ncbi:putative reverse transcriptase domain-containing protein [Tanacetum coccineum]
MKERILHGSGSQIRQRHVDNDPGVSATSELFALACGPTPTPISVNSCVVNGVRFVVHNRDERRTTQNSGICSPGGNDGEMYYGQLQEILEFLYLSFKVVLFRVKWFDTRNEGRKVQRLVLRNNMTQILTKDEAFKDDQYILATQVKQCFYLEDMARRPPHWKVVEHVNHKKFSDGGVIVVEEDPDVIHFDNSSDLPLSTSLNDLNNATLHIDGQSRDSDDGRPSSMLMRMTIGGKKLFILVKKKIDLEFIDVNGCCTGPRLTGGGDDRPPTHHIPTGCGGCFVNRGKGTRKANLGGRKAGRLHTRQETRNLGLKKITDDKGPVPIRFEWDDKKTMMPLGGHASHCTGQYNAGIQQHLQKLYNTNKASLKAAHWVINPETGTYDVETIRQGRPESITPADWDAQIAFWNDPRNQARAAQNRENRARMASSETREYPSLIDTFFVTHTVNGVFIRDEDRAIYEEMVRLRALGSNTESGVPYTDEEINAMARKGKQRGHLPGVGRVLPGRARDVLIPPPPPPPQCTHNSGDVQKLKKKNKYLTKQWRCGDDEIADDEDGGEDEEDEEDGDRLHENVGNLVQLRVQFIPDDLARVSRNSELKDIHQSDGFSLEKFEGVDFRRWQKKMHFLLSSMSVVYVLTTPMPDDGGDNPTVEQVRKMAK